MGRHRTLGTFCFLGFLYLQSPACFAQLADVRLRGDISVGVVKSDGIQLASVTPLGRFSTLGLQAMLPVGVRINVIQRVSGFKNDVDDDGFDEYSIEDQGSWKVGKQYLPFGGGTLLRETAIAARIDSSLIFEGLPLALALVDQGSGRQYGVSARVGSRGQGVSVAFGKHFGINGTSFAVVNRSSTGEHSGWGRMYGADWNRRFGRFNAKVEGVILRAPEANQNDEEWLDLSLGYDLGINKRHSVLVGATSEIGTNLIFYRVQGVYTAQKGVQLEGLYRQNSNGFLDFSIFLRLKF